MGPCENDRFCPRVPNREQKSTRHKLHIWHQQIGTNVRVLRLSATAAINRVKAHSFNVIGVVDRVNISKIFQNTTILSKYTLYNQQPTNQNKRLNDFSTKLSFFENIIAICKFT